jgi:hypothetical protein
MELGTTGSGTGKGTKFSDWLWGDTAEIPQNYRYLGHLASTPGVVTNLDIYIIFQVKNKHTQPLYFLPIESFWNIQ